MGMARPAEGGISVERLTGREADGHAYIIGCQEFLVPKHSNKILQSATDRLAGIEDILGDDYDLDRLYVLVNQRISLREEVAERWRITGKIQLDRLRELVEADRDGRCVVLPISTPSMAYTLNPKSGDISSGFYRTPGAVLHDTERGYIVVKNRKAAEEALKGEQDD